jgi:hypothetical protein
MMSSRKQWLNLTTPWLHKLGLGTQLTPFDMERLSANLNDPADPLGLNSWVRMSSSSYGTVYSRTATTMRQIEAQVGTPVMERAMQLYYERWKFRHPGLGDLRDALIDGTGKPAIVNAAFNAYIYNTGKTDDRISSLRSEEVLPLPGYLAYKGKQVLVGSEQIDKAIAAKRKAWKAAHPNAKAFEGAFPYRSVILVRRDVVRPAQTLRVTFADGSHQDMAVTAQQSWQRFELVTRSKAVSAELDPDGLLRMDANKLNDSYAIAAKPQASRRWFGDFTSLLQAFFALLATV